MAPARRRVPGQRVAVVDCGTNTTRLLLAEVAGGTVRPALRRCEITRLGGQVDSSGKLSGEAIDRVAGVLEDYARRWRAEQVTRVAVCATSAVRDAANADDFRRRVAQVTGVTPVVVTGAEEADLTFMGVVATQPGRGGRGYGRHVQWRSARQRRARRLVVCDIGGGSTELAAGVGAPEHRVSLQIGSVRLRERHVRNDPALPSEYAAVVADIDAELEKVPDVYAATDDTPLVAVAGTATTLGAVAAGVAADGMEQVDGLVLTGARLAQVIEDLAWLPSRERLKVPAIVPGREDVVVTGGLLLARVLERFGFGSLQVRVADLLDGIALRLAAGRWPPEDRGVVA